jgi:hypothetical protein
MPLTSKSGFSEEDRRILGSPAEPAVLLTERHVYVSPFYYTNAVVGNYLEYGDKGMEFVADTGFITIVEEKPIVAVTVVGSGCVPRGYNICEWWEDGESIDNMGLKQIVKRQRVDNLNGTHPSIFAKLLFSEAEPHTWETVGQMANVRDCLKKLSLGFFEGVYLGFYENTAPFRLGPPYPHKVTIRCGCKIPEDPGTEWERYPGDYAIRVVETEVVV